MARFRCGTCNWGHIGGGSENDFLAHVRGAHDVDQRLGNCDHAICRGSLGSCETSKGRPRRLSDSEDEATHLGERHCIEMEAVEEERPAGFQAQDEDAITFRCVCGWGSNGNGTEEGFMQHLRGPPHNIQIFHGSSDYAYCRECLTTKGRPRKLPHVGALLKHLEESHGVILD